MKYSFIMIDVQAKAEALREVALMFRDIAEKEVREEALSTQDYRAIAGITNYLNANLLLDSAFIDEGDSCQLKMALVYDEARREELERLAPKWAERLFVR